MAKGIFISYRRDDSAGHAGRIYDRLEEYYGPDRVFRDMEDIVAGDDFVDTIRTTIDVYEVMLVVIGPTWLNITDANGRRRLEDPEDFVRLEVAAALQRTGVRVIPVLVNGARMPHAEELPPPLAPLAWRHAHEVLDTRFVADVDHLIKTLGGKRSKWLQNLVVTGVAGAIVVGAAGIVFLSFISPPEIAADVTLYEGGGEIADEREDLAEFTVPPDSTDGAGEAEATFNQYRAPFTVTYDYERRNKNAISISSVLPYRDLLERGGPIEGGGASLFWDWPRLSVKIVNNSDRVIQLSEIQLEVRHSEIDTEPIVMIRESTQPATLAVVNHGWGPMVDPAIEATVVHQRECDANEWLDTPRQSINDRLTGVYSNNQGRGADTNPGDPGSTAIYEISPLIPDELRDDTVACVFGVVEYRNERSESRSVKFKATILINAMGTNAAVSATAEYLIFLEAGRSGYTKSKPIAFEIGPASVKHFLIRLGTDKSASFDFTIALLVVGEDPIEADEVAIDILTPVYDPLGLRSENHRR